MSLTHTLCHELAAPPMSNVTPVVFVVDDDISVYESLELLIRREGWQPETFASAERFLECPRTGMPSCLVLDVSLPGLTGLELQKPSLSNGPTFQSSSSANTPMCPRRSRR